MADEGTKKGKKPLLGLPSDDGDMRLPTRKSRVTMDFSGPPLALPDEGVEAPFDGVDLEKEIGSSGPLSLELDGVGAIELVDRARESETGLDLAKDMRERFALDDFTGALRVAELLLGAEPDNADAKDIAEKSVRQLEQIYTSRLGGLDLIARVAVPEQEVRWLGLDHRAAFLLSRIDGSHTVEEIIDISGMARLEALKTLVDLKELKALALE